MDEAEESGVTDSPKKGPTLSTSTSSFEALDPHDPNLSRLATKMFKDIGVFISNDLNTPLEEYKLLEQMNKITQSKYSDMKQITDNLVSSSMELKLKYDDLTPYLEQIDDIDATVDRLEAAAYHLDAYTQRLEGKFKQLIHKK